MLPNTFTDSLLLVKDVVGELLPEPEKQTSKKIYSLVQTRDVERPSPRLPMSAATHAAISAQLSPHPPTFSPNKLYDFLPTSQDPQPLLLVKKPAREAGLQHFVISSSTSSSLQNFDRHLVSHTSKTGYFLCAGLGTRGPSTVGGSRPILIYGWVGGTSFEGSTGIHPRSDILHGKGLGGWHDLRQPGGGPTTLSVKGPDADQYVKVRRGTERSTSHTSIDRRYSFQREVERGIFKGRGVSPVER